MKIPRLNPPDAVAKPEITALDHHLAKCRGSTMALETMHSRLQRWKNGPPQSLSQLKDEKLCQYTQQEYENDFYRKSFQIFHQLASTVMDTIQSLQLEYHFKPATVPAKDPRLIRTVILLQIALDKSHTDESEAITRWKNRCGIQTGNDSPSEWL
jgi:molybdopterin-biosynthesis enzyme MoeA-like protein